MCASPCCWQHKCSLTFDRNVLDLSWICFDAHAVCSFWLIAPLIKAISPSDLFWVFPSLLSPSHLWLACSTSVLSFTYLFPCLPSSILASRPSSFLPPALHHLTPCLSSHLFCFFPLFLLACLCSPHTILSFGFSLSLPVVVFQGKIIQPLRDPYFVCRGTSKTDSFWNHVTCKQLTKSDAMCQQAASNTQNYWRLNKG